jgi:hypothetical protein
MLSLKERKEALNNFTKFLIVRDPYERLLSAYRDIFERLSPHKDRARIIKNLHVLQKYVPMDLKATKPLSKRHRDVEFYQFIQFLLAPSEAKVRNIPHNRHWRPMDDLCFPCSIDYTILGKFETLVEDSNFVLHSIGVKDMKFPSGTPTIRNFMKEYYNSIPVSFIPKITNIYKNDLELFDYDIVDSF